MGSERVLDIHWICWHGLRRIHIPRNSIDLPLVTLILQSPLLHNQHLEQLIAVDLWNGMFRQVGQQIYPASTLLNEDGLIWKKLKVCLNGLTQKFVTDFRFWKHVLP